MDLEPTTLFSIPLLREEEVPFELKFISKFSASFSGEKA
jgi:hypothetical protein